jgi:predicted acetyltransferase
VAELMRRSRVQLVRPATAYLPGYVAALARGWSTDTERGVIAANDELARIGHDATTFLRLLDDRDAKGPPIELPDGSRVKRLPGFYRWIWDGEFVGSIAFRWQPGTTDLPDYCLGHIGYSVVPWKRRRGYGTRALSLLLPLARREGLAFVEITTDVDNVGSQRVIVANGGVLAERFVKPAAFGGTPGLRYRIHFA